MEASLLERPQPAEITAHAEADKLAAAWLIGYSPKTRNAYLADLKDFAAFCREHDLDPLTAHRSQVDAYKATLEARGLAPATIARRLSALSGFYEYAVDEELIARSPVSRVKRPKVGSDSPTLGLDGPELSRIVDAAATAGPRDHALICLLAFNGLRVSEVCNADASDLDTIRGHRVLTITRKGGSKATAPLAPRTAEALGAHLDGRSEGPLLLANDGGRLTRHGAARIVKRLARAAGLGEKRITPHSLRHTFVTLSLDQGTALRDVQDAAGHADPRTTRRYDQGRQSLDRHPTYALASSLG